MSSLTPSFTPAEAVAHLSQADPVLATLIDRVGAYAVDQRPAATPFSALLRSIIYQQLSGKAAQTIFGRLCALFQDPSNPTPDEILLLSDDAIRAAGVSRAKTKYVKDLANKTVEGLVPSWEKLSELSDEQIAERLTIVKGVGRWTVDMLLIFWMARPDVLPVADLGIRKGFMLTYSKTELPTPNELTEHAECWRPFRSVACWYLWRAVDLDFETP